MGRLDDIQTPLIPLKIREKLKQMFMTILGLAESFKMMNRSDQNAIWRPTSGKLYNIENWKFYPIVIQVFNLCFTKFGIDFFDTLETMRFSVT